MTDQIIAVYTPSIKPYRKKDVRIHPVFIAALTLCKEKGIIKVAWTAGRSQAHGV